MGFNVYFSNSTKPENSTEVFAITGKPVYDCTLKAGTSISNPVIELQASFSDFTALSANNVAYIPDFNYRFYFVTDWRYDGRLCVCALSVDVLGSFWNDLKTESFYVTRSASDNDPTIVDTAYPATAEPRYHFTEYASNPFTPASADYGCYIVGVLSKSSGLDGCITYYVMGYLQFMVLMGKLYDPTIYSDAQDPMGTTTGQSTTFFTDKLVEAIVNPLQYVSSIMWYPLSVATIVAMGWTVSTTNIDVGYTSIGMGTTVYYFDNSTLYKSFSGSISLSITAHPDSLGAEFLNLAPYAEYRLAFYPFGVFSIEADYLRGASDLYCIYTVDLRTGRGILNVSASSSVTESFLTSEAQVGVPIPTSTIQTQIGDMGNLREAGFLLGKNLFSGLESNIREGFTAISQAGRNPMATISALSDMGNNIVGTLTGELRKISGSDIESALLQASSSPNMSGTQGSISLFPTQPVSFNMWYKKRADTDNTHKGTPLCAMKQLSTLSGFTVCANAVASVSGATFAEKRKIESFLNTGFYIE